MQITKELIDNDIKGIEAQMEQLKVSVAQAAGALSTLKAIRDFLDRPEEKPKAKAEPAAIDPNVISDTNKIVQDREAARQAAMHPDVEALSEAELAELVAGPGAVLEAIEPLKENA